MRNQTAKHYTLYVLKCEQDKYYVGVTSNTVEHRFKQHYNGFAGAAWTKKYRPIKVIDTKDLGVLPYEAAEAYESKVVRVYLKRYGVNSTRGGDLRDTEEYVQRFGWLWLKDYWEMAIGTSLLVVVTVYSIILYYTK